MYINNFLCCLQSKEENKCGRIFRPWDIACSTKSINKDNAQDNTISTTTNEDDDIEIEIEDVNKEYYTKTKLSKSESAIKEEKPGEIKQSFRPLYKSSSQRSSMNKIVSSKNHVEDLSRNSGQLISHCAANTILSPSPMDYMSEVYNPLYPEVIQTNLAQSLGFPTNDPLLLESLAQGYALEEYARVLNQDHQARILASKKQRPKKYKCPHCDVGFSNNGQLKGHIRIHTGERPFKCDNKECGKTFTRNEELTRHKRIHSGLRPFPCTHCGKRFGRKDHLKKHSRTHFQPRGVYAVPVMLPFEAWASGSVNGYPFIPMY